MPIAAVPPAAASDGVARLYERLAEALGLTELPEAFHVYGASEPFLKDLFMNVKKYVVGDGKLDARSRCLVALAAAAHAKSPVWGELLTTVAAGHGIDETARTDALAVASTNYMYNTFFKFRELSGTDRFEGLPIGLRAHTFAGTSLSDAEVELINIAVSDMNACKPCVSGHVLKAKALDLSDEQILEAVQCAAVVYAGAQYLNAAAI